ncbi:hypothetical protein CRG98_028725 [Punica granatum]|uniref:Uncharacterized protein n=1 Tax=Punica granatum TaxID=22663 RepID=A0A2I0J3U7_PUNGR|nr:hypothetical protein CRG98_028725 [Punica granatum]
MVRNLLSIPCMSAFKLVMMANVVMADLMGKIESEGKMEVGQTWGCQSREAGGKKKKIILMVEGDGVDFLQVAPEEVGKSLRILGQFLPSFLLQE